MYLVLNGERQLRSSWHFSLSPVPSVCLLSEARQLEEANYIRNEVLQTKCRGGKIRQRKMARHGTLTGNP